MIFLGESGENSGAGIGCFTVKRFSMKNSDGAKMEFQRNELGEDARSTIPTENRDGIIITGISTQDQESVSHLPCFGDKVYTYAFGRQPGSITVSALVFLGPRNQEAYTEGNYLRRLFDLYRHNRISKALSTVRIVFPSNKQEAGVAVRGNLVGMSTQTKDGDVGLQQVQFTIVTTEAVGADQ